MLLRCLSLLCGAYALGLSHALPADDLFLPLVLLTAFCAVRRPTRLLSWFLTGFSLMWLAAWAIIDDRLDPALQGETLELLVRIADFPSETDATLRFVAEPLARPDLPARIRLSWYEADFAPRIGELWQLHVRLRRPHGYANPGGFDYEGWLFRERLGATGYVVSHTENRRRATAHAGSLSQFRQDFVDRVTRLLPLDDASAVLLAVSVGARHRITREQWDRYAITGTIHLMAISGLHIGLASGVVYLLAWCAFAPCCRQANVRDLASITALLAAVSYAVVSGFAVPAQRAFLMAMLAAVAVLYRYRLRLPSLVSIPCIALFLANPLAIHAPGFKLSFAAVAIILWLLQYRHAPPRHAGLFMQKARSYLRGLGLLQIFLLAGLFPLTTLIFGRFSLVAPLINLLILPLFNFLTVPFCLAGMLLHGPLEAIGDQFLSIAYQSVRLVLCIVSFTAGLPLVESRVLRPQGIAVLILLLPAMYVVLPPGWPGRKLAWLAIAAAVVYRPSNPPRGCLDYQVLDVGQGLAVVLRTAHHVTLFDTGPAFRSGSSTAELVVVPFLRSRGIDRLDTLILSHADQDHAGGAESIKAEFPIGTTFVGELVAVPGLVQSVCNTAIRWSVDQVQFHFLHPSPGRTWNGNNASCVLEVKVGGRVLLLTGDIEAPVEASLLERGDFGPVDTVVVPHHGSRTSSSVDFIERLGADLAIVSAGFGNRWGFPKPDIVRRWQNGGAVLLETATSGAIGQRMCVDSGVTTPSTARRDARRYWHE